MTPQQQEQLNRLEAEVARLRQELDMRKNQQFQTPLDDASIQVLLQALYNKRIDRLTVKDLRYVTQTAVS